MSNLERDARLREEATEDSSSSEEVFIISFFQHLSTHCIALVVQETDEHLEDGADSSSEEVFAIFDHS